MPALQSIVLTDRATPTPVNHTFTPQGVKDGKATAVKRGSVPFGDPTFSIAKRETADRVHVVIKTTVPVMVTETINGVSVNRILFSQYAESKFTLSKMSNAQQRKDIVGMHMSSMGADKTLVNSVLVDLEDVWGA